MMNLSVLRFNTLPFSAHLHVKHVILPWLWSCCSSHFQVSDPVITLLLARKLPMGVLRKTRDLALCRS